MARKIIDTGIVGNDGTGDSIRDSFRKVNDNFRELYSSLGLGERLTFIGLDDTPTSYEGQYDPATKSTPILSTTDTESGIVFKHLREGAGIKLNFESATDIVISSEFSEIKADPSPQLGGDLSAKSGGEQYRILDLGDNEDPLLPIYQHEAVNKDYADGKISLAGVDAYDPAIEGVNTAFGVMTGPLVLSRDPNTDDDEIWDGMVAATKRYVDNSAFGSIVNLYVATSGSDERVGVSPELQGRALAYAYRTLEAALKRAEEIMLESRKEIGPYKKVLTFNDGVDTCTLAGIDVAPSSGTGFIGNVLMSVDTARINNPGQNYSVGDIITVVSDTLTTIEPARYEVLSVGALPGTSRGPVITFRQLSSGVYTALPGNSGVATTATSSTGGSTFGLNCLFDLTYKVNNAAVTNGGENYGLVSVRITGGGGSGAFGTADVVGGIVQSITITDGGSGFTSMPSVVVNLPRFLLRTDGQRTDFTGDVLTSTAAAIRTRDIREGLYLRGESSGALAQILSHDGSLDSDGNEIFDVDILYGSFVLDEAMAYGDFTKSTQITVLVESGIYEENLPLRVPQNVSVVGNEFRRCIIRPKPGVSSSPWAFLYFRRDLQVDGLTTASDLYGYHYLTDTTQPVYPLIDNKGYYRSAAQLVFLNRGFIQQQVIGWINDQVENNIAPFDTFFTYNQELCQRDVGLIIDAMIFDLKWGGSDRTISAALKYYGSASGLIAINEQLDQTVAGINRINALAQLCVKNIPITDLYGGTLPQIVDGAFIAEVGSVGVDVNIFAITNANPVVITTSTPHTFTTGDQVIFGDVGGTTELNGNEYYITRINDTAFTIHNLADLSDQISSLTWGTFTSGGIVSEPKGVIGDLIQAFVDVIDLGVNYGTVNLPKNNDMMDMFLANDAVRWQAITCQGHGGFAMVLDPNGQILAKSPYAQECASFSRSTGRRVFSGGMYIDGFTGNVKFEMTGKAEINASAMLSGRSYTIKTTGTTDFTLLGAVSNAVGTVFTKNGITATGNGTVDDNGFLRVGGLKRMPQLPASFIVNDTVYRINYVRDFTFNVAGSTASFVLDENTPWSFKLFDYNPDICSRDVGLIIDGLGYDIALGTNFHQRRAGLSYRQANAAVVINDQLQLTVRAIKYAHELAFNAIDGYSAQQATVLVSSTKISEIVQNGATFAPTLTLTDPPGVATNISRAKAQLINNNAYIRDEVTAWIAAQVAGNIAPFSTGFTYDSVKWARNIGNSIEAATYDVLYGGNSATRHAAIEYYNGVGDEITLQLGAGELDEAAAAIDYASYLAQQVVQNLAPAVSYSATPRVPGPAASATEAATIAGLMTGISAVITGGIPSVPAEILPNLSAYAYTAGSITARTLLQSGKADIQSGVIAFIDENANVYEVLMPGNRSMLSNDFTQINDLGYGVVVNNGGLAEAVSMFTYYCHISYYSLNGGQIRSVAGSSAHGNYALVAEGADPLEIPTPVGLYYDLSQPAEVYNDGGTYANVTGGLVIFITNYDYVPLNNSELEIDHGNAIFRYPVSSVSLLEELPGVVRLNLASSEGSGVDGLFLAVPDTTKITIRQGSQTVLFGDVVDVATRPSTGLILRESPSVYRILTFDEYFNTVSGSKVFTISIANPAVINSVAHGLQPGFLVSFITTGALPTGVSVGTRYYVLPDNFTNDSFLLSTTKGGSPVITTGTQSGTHTFITEGLARTTLRENYNYVDFTVWPTQPFVSTPATCTISIASPGVVTMNGHGLSSGDVIKFTTTGALPTGLSATRMFFVKTVLGLDTFTLTDTPGGDVINTSGSQSGTHTSGKVIGRAGDDSFAVVPLGEDDQARVLGTKLVWKGEEYVVSAYSSEAITLQPYALLTLSRVLVDSVIDYESLPTLKAGVPKFEPGTLTIRISLTRVTGHDLLEIGTGSYADTNYPNEIYGPAVNALNPAAETEERGVGRCFYVTTDQFGNFSVGPYFKVDQGTGSVTFAASIALSNLDGIGFKRGVPVAEFSTDSSFSDNATDTVPTENATRAYMERRLGLTHGGSVVPAPTLIPSLTGGFMALDGQLAMKADMKLGNHKISEISDPIGGQDAVNLRSLTFNNFQELTLTSSVRANDIMTFTGEGREAINTSIVGDISLNIDSTAHTLDAQINPEVILNADVNPTADIAQSKLLMTLAATRAAAPTGTSRDKQAASGVASFDSTQFTITDGWVTLKSNGVRLADLPQIAADTVLGNSLSIAGNIAAVPFATIVNEGLGVKKSNFTTVGYLRRKNSLTANGDTGSSTGDSYEMIDHASANTADTLVKRDASGDFAGRYITGERFIVDSKILADTNVSGGGGVIQLYSYLGQAAILLGDGSLSTDKRNYYDNEAHIFRPQNGVGNAPITCSSVTATTLTTGGAGTQGNIIGDWRLGSGSKLQATYADLAEFYSADKEYAPGTVLVFGGDAEVTASSKHFDTRVAGVVTTDPAYVMNSELQGTRACVALQGRVPVRVVGKISKGDLLVTSSITGVAVSAGGNAQAGTILGKALENYNSDHIGTIEVAVGRA